MDTATSALAVACMGIVGTLASGLLTHRSARKNKLQELEHADRQKDVERSHDARKAHLEARRAAYISLNGAARSYQTELTNYLHAHRAGEVSDEVREEVEGARREHRASHAEGQMILPDEILEVASAVNLHLGRLYGVLRRLDLGNPGAGETVELADSMRARSWDLLAAMRLAMRADLGVSSPQGV
ncbi:hypothetical protein ACPC54_26060 [Kitasatospora sp. NPDC094028]